MESHQSTGENMAKKQRDVHIGRSACLLCKQQAVRGSIIVDMKQNSHVASSCEFKCTGCSHGGYPAVWHHQICFDVLRDTYKPSEAPTPEDLRAFSFTFKQFKGYEDGRETLTTTAREHGDISRTWEGLFCGHTARCLQNTFSQVLLGRLPVELLAMIVKLVKNCWYLVLLGETRRLMSVVCARRKPGSKRLKPTEELWVSRIEFRGNYYMTELDSKPLPIAKTKQYRVSLPDQVNRIVISFDSFGIRGIQFIGPDSEASPDDSPWYQVIYPVDQNFSIFFKCNAIFIQELKILSGDATTEGRTWTSPNPPRLNPWNVYQGRKASLLNYVEFDCELQGLLVCCADGRMTGLHGFSGKSTRFTEFVQLNNVYGITRWLYFPFSPNESIIAAWVRKKKVEDGAGGDTILVLQSSLGRIMTFGPQIQSNQSHFYEHYPLVREGDGIITGILFGNLGRNSRDVIELGVTCSDGLYRTTTLIDPPLGCPLKLPQVWDGMKAAHGYWYLTYAPLEGLTKIQVFRDLENDITSCTGALLTYGDGRLEALGQVRWDKQVTVEPCSLLAVEAGLDYHISRVRDIQGRVPDSELRVNSQTGWWSRLPDRGILVWWFGECGDRLSVHYH